MKNICKPILWAALLGCCCIGACKKDFLDVRPDKSLLVPATLSDLRLLINNTQVFNLRPNLTSFADGNYYTDDAGYNALGEDMERNSYIWAKEIFAGIPTGDWNTPFRQIFYANVVLEGMEKLPPAEATAPEGKAIRGTALFFRAFALYHLATEFALPYDASTAGSVPGIPVRLRADVTQHVGRGTLAQTYAQIAADLASARELLPATVTVKTRPTVKALQAFKARVALAMEDYPKATLYADSVISAGVELIDYNTLNPAAARPFPRSLPNGNPEVIFYAALQTQSFDVTSAATYIDRDLYNAYKGNDLRKQIFFREVGPGDFKFKGNYSGTLAVFGGLAADEIYLIRAEGRARAGDAAGAMADLNKLLVNRYLSGTYVPVTATDPADALAQVLTERRKELPGRNLRWEDLRRLNRDPRFRVALSRTVNGQTYMLEPQSPRYVYPIPDEEISLGGLEQNSR